MVSGVCGRNRVRGRLVGGREAHVGGWKGLELSPGEMMLDVGLFREMDPDNEARVEAVVAEVGAWIVVLE